MECIRGGGGDDCLLHHFHFNFNFTCPFHPLFCSWCLFLSSSLSLSVFRRDTFTCVSRQTNVCEYSQNTQCTMLRAIIQEVFMRAIIYVAAVHNYVVNWTPKWPLVISMRPHQHQSMGHRRRHITMTFKSSWFYRIFCHFPSIWSTLNTKQLWRVHRSPRTSFIRQCACPHRAHRTIWRKWCRMRI